MLLETWGMNYGQNIGETINTDSTTFDNLIELSVVLFRAGIELCGYGLFV